MVEQHVPRTYNTWRIMMLFPPSMHSQQLVKVNWLDLDSGKGKPDGCNSLGQDRPILPLEHCCMTLSHLPLLSMDQGDDFTSHPEGVPLHLPPLLLLPCPLPLLVLRSMPFILSHPVQPVFSFLRVFLQK